MEFGSTQVIKPVKKVNRGASKDPSKPLKETTMMNITRPQVNTITKKPSVSQDVRQVTTGVRAAGTSLIVKRGASVDKDAAKKKAAKTKKQMKKEELLEKKRLLDEEEEERLMVEERRRFELERFRRLQADKLTKEEKERLFQESNIEEEFQLRFQARVYFEERKRIVQMEWANFLNCESEPNPDSEKDQTEYLFRYGEQNEINSVDKAEFYLKKSDYSESVVVSRLIEAYLSSQADNKYEKGSKYEKFIMKVRGITLKKLQELTTLLINNQQVFFDEKNEQLKELEKLPITPDNLRTICGSVSMKPDERYKYEIFKTFESEDFAIALWWTPLERCGYRMKPIEFKRPNVSIEVPRNLNGQPLYVRCLWTRTDYLSSLFAIQKFMVIGGVFQIEAFNMIPLMKRRKKYALKIDFGDSEVPGPLKYPPEVAGTLANLPSLKVQLEIPAGMYLPADFKPKVAYFSESTKSWTEDGIEIHKYDIDLRQVYFSTKILAPLAIVQDVCLDFPYKSFQIRCVDENIAVLDLQTKRMWLKFQITDEEVTLIDDGSNRVDPTLKYLANQPMNHSRLLQELQRKGVNLIPQSWHANFSDDCVAKVVDVENKSLQEFMMAIKAFAVKSCPRNSSAGEEVILFEIKQNFDYSLKLSDGGSTSAAAAAATTVINKNTGKRTTSTNEEDSDWIQTAIWCNKCAFINPKAKSIDSSQVENLLSNSTTHAMISLILNSHPTLVPHAHDIVERMNDVYHSSFQNNLRRFLKLLRILSFS